MEPSRSDMECPNEHPGERHKFSLRVTLMNFCKWLG
jgi:hypothetical protein